MKELHPTGRLTNLPEIVGYPDPVLRSRASEVLSAELGPEIRSRGEQMLEVMRSTNGVGLAAPQLGWLKRVIVMQANPGAPAQIIVNPEFEITDPTPIIGLEACLSIPYVTLRVPRVKSVRLTGADPEGKQLRFDAALQLAVILQHEVDHLNGVTILDRVSRQVRRQAMQALREGRPYAEQPAGD